MDWIVIRQVARDTPASLRLRATEFLRLAGEAKHEAVSRELKCLALHYIDLARDLERRRPDRPAIVEHDGIRGSIVSDRGTAPIGAPTLEDAADRFDAALRSALTRNGERP